IPGAVFNPDSSSPTPARGDELANTGDQETIVAAGPDAAKTTGPFRVRIDASAVAVSQGGSVTFRVSACNVSADPVVRTFASGQRYDFKVVNGATVLWQWSHGRQFGRFGGSEVWQPRECRTFSEDWGGTDSGSVPLAPGRYLVKAEITATDPADSGTTPICV